MLVHHGSFRIIPNRPALASSETGCLFCDQDLLKGGGLRGGSTITNAKTMKKFLVGSRGMLPRERFGFELSNVPFPVFLTDFCKTVESGMGLCLSSIKVFTQGQHYSSGDKQQGYACFTNHLKTKQKLLFSCRAPATLMNPPIPPTYVYSTPSNM